MKKLQNICHVVLEIFLPLLFVAGTCYYAYCIYHMRKIINEIYTETPHITEWQYKGHDMLRYDYHGSYSVCHSPTCKKCYQIFD